MFERSAVQKLSKYPKSIIPLPVLYVVVNIPARSAVGIEWVVVRTVDPLDKFQFRDTSTWGGVDV